MKPLASRVDQPGWAPLPGDMASLQECLAAAEACLGAGNPREALQHCKAALKADKKSADAFM